MQQVNYVLSYIKRYKYLSEYLKNDLIMINIYDYLDYRAYLNDYWQTVKEEKPYFSIRFIANKVGLSPGYILKVMQSKVHLGAKNIPAFCDLLKISDNEKIYFEELVYFGREKNEKELERRYYRLSEIKGIRMRTVADNSVEFYKNWYNMALRSLISFYPFYGKNFKQLGSFLSPPITAKQVKESINLLEKLKMIKKDEYGVYILTETFISTGEKWMSPIIRKYQQQNIALAGESLERHKKELRDISTVTMTFGLKSMPELSERIKKFRRELLMMSSDISDEDSVLQLNIQVFPSAIVPDSIVNKKKGKK